MHGNSAHLRAQAERFLRERLRPALYRDREPVRISRWDVPDEPVPASEALAQEYAPAALGDPWGTPWGTTWFRVEGTIPERWRGAEEARIELVVDPGFSGVQTGFECEATGYTADGRIIKAVEPHNRYVTLPQEPGRSVEVYIEAAANPDVIHGWTFAPTPMGSKETAGTEPQYRLRELHIGLRDERVAALVADLELLLELADEVGHASTRGAEILAAVGRAVRAMDPHAVTDTAARGREELAEVLRQPAAASAHTAFAVGHAHIDSAWLWPARETVRKVARTFSNVVALLEEGDGVQQGERMPEAEGLVFAASSAQQYAWLQEHQPELYERVRRQIAAGRFVPVGGMWVESDTNLPGGEALARQLVAGTRYFREQFGVPTQVVWLPDSFGYSAALPQLIALAGARWFLTQKLSWNETNRIPHHTFLWEGLDGTRVFTHFPPVDTYGSDLRASDLAKAERQFAEKGAARSSLVPFGWGDGGGGPTREMLARAHRTADLEGSPRVRLASPQEFFEAAEAEYADPPVWSGELYLEFHRGTYTSQARTKRGNRRSEALLREAELWATTASVRAGAPYPRAELEEAWRVVLLQQFHDILPGTSIAWVHQEAERRYAEVARVLEDVIGRSLAALAGPGDVALAANAGPFAVAGVPALGVGAVSGAGGPADGASVGGRDADGRVSGGGELGGPVDGTTPAAAPGAVSGEVLPDGSISLQSPFARMVVAADGTISSLVDLAADREVVPDGGAVNILQLFRDTPNQWDAWDIDADYRLSGTDLRDVELLELVDAESGPSVRVIRRFGASRVTQEIALAADRPAVTIRTTVDWHEQQKLLKLAFGFDVHAERATSEIQFGHIHRPTHANTSWDNARFETVAHRWVHVGEPGYGIAVANDATYGHDIRRDTRPGGGTTTTVCESLLRAPLFPDPEADQGVHAFTTVIRLGAGIADAIEEGYRLNLPLRRVTGGGPVEPLMRVEGGAVVVEAVKLAEDRSGDVVVRLYESLGGRAVAVIAVDGALDAARAVRTDLHEDPLDGTAASLDAEGGRIRLRVRPFEIVTLRIPRAAG